MGYESMSTITETRIANGRAEPHWPAFVALVSTGGLFAALPSNMVAAPSRWLFAVTVVLLLLPTRIAQRRGKHYLSQAFGYILNAVVTAALIASLAMLLIRVTAHEVTPQQLLRSAAALWVANFLVFASWYWRLDAGGPHERSLTVGHTDGAFLFPQMTMPPEAKMAAGEHEWAPKFVDYLSSHSTRAQRSRRRMYRRCRAGQRC